VAGAGKSEDGTNPEGHIWKIAPTRRDLLGFLGWGAVLNSIGIGTLAFVRFMYPRVLFEPPIELLLHEANVLSLPCSTTRSEKVVHRSSGCRLFSYRSSSNEKSKVWQL